MQNNEAQQTPHGFIEEAGMYGQIRIDGAVRIIRADPCGNLSARHAEDAVGI